MTNTLEKGVESVGVARRASQRRLALKAATDAAHAHLERIVESGDMFGSVAGYRRYLAATWAMRDHFERLLDLNCADDLWPAWPGRRIAHLAAQDMADLGLPAPSPQNIPVPRLSGPELLGVLYVLEGSSLGARVILRMVSALGLSETFAARHLDAQASDTVAWRSFLAMLESCDHSACHVTANSVFRDFADAYERARA